MNDDRLLQFQRKWGPSGHGYMVHLFHVKRLITAGPSGCCAPAKTIWKAWYTGAILPPSPCAVAPPRIMGARASRIQSRRLWSFLTPFPAIIISPGWCLLLDADSFWCWSVPSDWNMSSDDSTFRRNVRSARSIASARKRSRSLSERGVLRQVTWNHFSQYRQKRCSSVSGQYMSWQLSAAQWDGIPWQNNGFFFCKLGMTRADKPWQYVRQSLVGRYPSPPWSRQRTGNTGHSSEGRVGLRGWWDAWSVWTFLTSLFSQGHNLGGSEKRFFFCYLWRFLRLHPKSDSREQAPVYQAVC